MHNSNHHTLVISFNLVFTVFFTIPGTYCRMQANVYFNICQTLDHSVRRIKLFSVVSIVEFLKVCDDLKLLHLWLSSTRRVANTV
jgi:hypothetical protein